MSAHAAPCGIPWEAWEMLDSALQEALLEERIEPQELVDWIDGDDGETQKWATRAS